ncbi:hypothetical protein QJS83_12785 [Bdellovibrio sp. 22V]|uniref:hypothetical protein n=1 Tax=Bdellovibrio TaxID=958 RepID=UPI002543F96C|nr:hypothetical protein [Bdellovibrio sp. 22V]WII71339.1 hypothetical protein QJS83_12785 [Bdellovibrio sp. 22V]
MKSLLVSMSLLLAAPAFANCVSEMMAGAAQGNREEAVRMCRKAQSTCNVSEIIKNNHGINYADAMALCSRKLESNAKLIECMARGYNYSTCQQQN